MCSVYHLIWCDSCHSNAHCLAHRRNDLDHNTLAKHYYRWPCLCSMCECVYLMALMPIKRSLSSEQAIDAVLSGLLANTLLVHVWGFFILVFVAYVVSDCMSQSVCSWLLWQNVRYETFFCCAWEWSDLMVLVSCRSNAYCLAYSISHRRNDLDHNNLARHYYR